MLRTKVLTKYFTGRIYQCTFLPHTLLKPLPFLYVMLKKKILAYLVEGKCYLTVLITFFIITEVSFFFIYFRPCAVVRIANFSFNEVELLQKRFTMRFFFFGRCLKCSSKNVYIHLLILVSFFGIMLIKATPRHFFKNHFFCLVSLVWGRMLFGSDVCFLCI